MPFIQRNSRWLYLVFTKKLSFGSSPQRNFGYMAVVLSNQLFCSVKSLLGNQNIVTSTGQ